MPCGRDAARIDQLAASAGFAQEAEPLVLGDDQPGMRGPVAPGRVIGRSRHGVGSTDVRGHGRLPSQSVCCTRANVPTLPCPSLLHLHPAHPAAYPDSANSNPSVYGLPCTPSPYLLSVYRTAFHSARRLLTDWLCNPNWLHTTLGESQPNRSHSARSDSGIITVRLAWYRPHGPRRGVANSASLQAVPAVCPRTTAATCIHLRVRCGSSLDVYERVLIPYT